MAIIQSGASAALATVDSTYNALQVLPKGVGTVTYNPNDFTKDSFERLRVSEPVVVFEYGFNNGGAAVLNPSIWEGTTYGAGSITTNTTAWHTELNTTTATTTGYWAQTWAHIRYAPGISTVFRGTFNFNLLQSNLTMRFGMFSEQGTFPGSPAGDGVYLEAVGSTINIVIRSQVSGSIVETRIAQTSWNKDTMNGAGSSGVTLDWTKSQHLVIEYQWLGVGEIRVGFETGATGVVWAHALAAVNLNAAAWCRSGSLPIRAECFTTGAVGSAGKLTLINCSVIQEGLVQQRGWRYFSANSGATVRTGGTATGLYPLIAIRGALTNDITKRTTIIPLKASILVKTAATTSTAMQWALLAIPTPLTGATFAVVTHGGATNSSTVAVDQASTATTAVTGTVLASGILPVTAGLYTMDFSNQLDNIIKAGQNAAGGLTITGMNVLCLAYGPLDAAAGAGAAAWATIDWKELS